MVTSFQKHISILAFNSEKRSVHQIPLTLWPSLVAELAMQDVSGRRVGGGILIAYILVKDTLKIFTVELAGSFLQVSGKKLTTKNIAFSFIFGLL